MATLDGNYIDPMNVSARQTGIRWGLILGLISSVVSLIMYFTGIMESGKSTWISTLASIIPIVVCIYYAQVQHRDNELGGYMSLGRAVTVALWVGLIAGLIAVAFILFFFNFVMKDFGDVIINRAVEQAEAQGQDADKVRSSMEMMKWFFTPAGISMFAFFGTLFYALLGGLIIGLFTKRESNKPF